MYNINMDKDDTTPSEASAPHERLAEFRAITSVEGKIPTPEMISLFEKFERENWPHEKRRAYIIEYVKAKA